MTNAIPYKLVYICLRLASSAVIKTLETTSEQSQQKFNVPLIDQFDTKIDFTTNIQVKNAIIGQVASKIETPVIQVCVHSK